MALRERLDKIEAKLAALVQRIGELEKLCKPPSVEPQKPSIPAGARGPASRVDDKDKAQASTEKK